MTDRDDDLGVLDLDDMPGIPPLVRNARVAADLLFVDPPPAFVVRVHRWHVHIAGLRDSGFEEWAARHLDEIPAPSDALRKWIGTIEGVPFEAVCEVTA